MVAAESDILQIPSHKQTGQLERKAKNLCTIATKLGNKVCSDHLVLAPVQEEAEGRRKVVSICPESRKTPNANRYSLGRT